MQRNLLDYFTSLLVAAKITKLGHPQIPDSHQFPIPEWGRLAPLLFNSLALYKHTV